MTFQKNLLRVRLGLLLLIVSGTSLASLAGAGSLPSERTGPTLHLDYGASESKGNSIVEFMYFVPLISPEPVTVEKSEGNTQRARVISATRKVSDTNFLTTCEFEFTGVGIEKNVLDHTKLLLAREADLKKGACLERQLSSINVEGDGSGCIEIEGTITNQIYTVNEVRLRFNRHGHPSPVTIGLQDLRWRDGKVEPSNEIVAHVNTLTFRRSTGTPKMEVTVASVKPKAAHDNLWQSFMGQVRGAAANLLIKPISVEPSGHKAMLSFGQALVSGATSFTFPMADHLKTGALKEP